MKTKASEYICEICKERLAETWHHLILPGRGMGRKENDRYAMPLCGNGKPWDDKCHGRCQRNEISLQLQGIFLLRFHKKFKANGVDLDLIFANHLSVGDITKILRKELGE